MTTTPQAALLREAAQNALTTLDGIANANPRDTADFETPAEWIAWAKSRARWAADALRAPVAQEVYAERILKQMLQAEKKCGTCGFIGQEDPVKGCPKCGFDDMQAKLQATQAEPVQAGELPEPDAVFYCSEDTGYLTQYRRPPANLTDGDVAMYEADTVRSLLISAALAARKPLTPTDEQVTAAARAMCDEFAADCNVDRDDAWMIHCEEFKDSARRALISAFGINGLEVKP